MILFTTYEKNKFVGKSIESLTNHIFLDDEDKILFFKVLVNYLDKREGNKLQYSKLSEQILSDSELLKTYYREILNLLADVASNQDESVSEYTTGQLSTYFGVSITTINNWINDGRFIGYKRKETNEQARIKGNTLWKSRTGKVYPVQEIVDEWVKDNPESNNMANDEKVFLINQNAAFEIKYKGPYRETLGSKPLSEMTSMEESDASVWRYFIKRLQDEYGL
ncbi:packaged DNA stabilization protein [Gottfriedia acidiceleris]|uniref:packaged DNA stabilization protein n=1 Tax=Gottfriedia acidiceleris TaxID=371036 RepID=UPI00101C3647|nr:packaged DNA stabilization protein [Gottfriedia acidiceleris]